MLNFLLPRKRHFHIDLWEFRLPWSIIWWEMKSKSELSSDISISGTIISYLTCHQRWLHHDSSAQSENTSRIHQPERRWGTLQINKLKNSSLGFSPSRAVCIVEGFGWEHKTHPFALWVPRTPCGRWLQSKRKRNIFVDRQKVWGLFWVPGPLWRRPKERWGFDLNKIIRIQKWPHGAAYLKKGRKEGNVRKKEVDGMM